jgi:hypothetical protein
MLRCSVCHSRESIMVLGDARRTCAECHAGVVREGPRQGTTRSALAEGVGRERHPAIAATAPGTSPLDLALAIVGSLVDEYGATVLEYDVDPEGGHVDLRIPTAGRALRPDRS